jgi:rubrerythrin
MDADLQSKNAELGTEHSELPVWRCPNCGQSYFGKHPPDLCDYCQDFTTWHLVKSP